MKIAEVRKIMAAKPAGWRVAYLTLDDVHHSVAASPCRLTPESDEPPLSTFDEADYICKALTSNSFSAYQIARAWVVEA